MNNEEYEMVKHYITDLSSNVSHVSVCKSDIMDVDSDTEYSEDQLDENGLNDFYSDNPVPDHFFDDTVERLENDGCKVSVEDNGTMLIINASGVYDED